MPATMERNKSVVLNFIFKTFNIKQEESMLFGLLFLHSFFLVGVFISFYFVPANSVFITHFGSEQLPFAYISAGIMGYLTTMLYSWLQNRTSSRLLFLGATGFLIVITLLIRILAYLSASKWISFFGFICAWPFISLVAIKTGGLALRLMNLRQVKRLFGPIGIGGIIASILSYFTIPVLIPSLSNPYDLFYIAIAGAAVAMGLLIYLYREFPEHDNRAESTDDEDEIPEDRKNGTSFRQLLKEKYFRLIFLSAMLSMVMLYFTDFAYLSSIKVQKELLPSAAAVSNFIALVCGVFKIGELILSALSSRILSNRGVRLGLTILPFAATGLIAVATILGLSFGIASLAFFAIIVINKSSERILRRGLDDPSFNILYQPLPDHQKFDVQTKVGVVTQMSIGIAGVLLLIVSTILTTKTGFKLQYYNLFFLPILVFWSYTAINLYNSYRDKLRQVLEEKNTRRSSKSRRDIYGSDVILRHIANPEIDEKKLELGVTILSETNPLLLQPFAEKLLQINNPVIRNAVIRNIEPTWDRNLKPLLEKIAQTDKHEDVSKVITQAVSNLNFTRIAHYTGKEIMTIVREGSTNERIELIKHMLTSKMTNEKSLISELLRTEKRIVRQAALNLAVGKDYPELIPEIADLLLSPEMYHLAANLLIKIGDKCLPTLENKFKSTQDLPVLAKIIEAMSRIGSAQSQALLLEKINYAEKDIQKLAIDGLYYSQFQANDRQRPIVKRKIEQIASNIIWLYACINEIESQKNTLKLIQAIDLEREANYEILFKLLSFIYQPATIDLIKTNLIGENIIFALEIVDNFIQQDIKQLIIPLFDSISIGQRLKKMHEFFPQEKMKFTDRLRDIVVAEYDKVDLWTVTKAMELLGRLHRHKKSTEISDVGARESNEIELWNRENIEEILAQIRRSEMPDEIFLCLYHKDELIYSTAAKILFDENPRRCYDNLQKLPVKKQELYEVLEKNEESEEKRLLVEKVKLIKRLPLFFSIPENALVKLGKIIRVRLIAKNELIDYLNEEYENSIIFILRGMLMNKERHHEATFYKGDIVIRGLNIDDETENLVARKETLVLYANRFEYFNLLINEIEMINRIL